MSKKYKMACEHARSGLLIAAALLFQELAKAVQSRGLSPTLYHMGNINATLDSGFSVLPQAGEPLWKQKQNFEVFALPVETHQ